VGACLLSQKNEIADAPRYFFASLLCVQPAIVLYVVVRRREKQKPKELQKVLFCSFFFVFFSKREREREREREKERLRERGCEGPELTQSVPEGKNRKKKK
jgi:hypothetical protein